MEKRIADCGDEEGDCEVRLGPVGVIYDYVPGLARARASGILRLKRPGDVPWATSGPERRVSMGVTGRELGHSEGQVEF